MGFRGEPRTTEEHIAYIYELLRRLRPTPSSTVAAHNFLSPTHLDTDFAASKADGYVPVWNEEQSRWIPGEVATTTAPTHEHAVAVVFLSRGAAQSIPNNTSTGESDVAGTFTQVTLPTVERDEGSPFLEVDGDEIVVLADVLCEISYGAIFDEHASGTRRAHAELERSAALTQISPRILQAPTIWRASLDGYRKLLLLEGDRIRLMVAQNSGASLDLLFANLQVSVVAMVGAITGGGGDGGGGVTDHEQLDNVLPDQHHAQDHTLSSHTDTDATGTQLDQLVGGGTTVLHTHPGTGSQGELLVADDECAPPIILTSEDECDYLYADQSDDAEGDDGDTAPADLYVATTGSDVSGDGTSGTPYATLAKALSRLQDLLETDHTIHVADGTYNEPLEIARFHSHSNAKLKITGNPTTPSNVVLTGTVTANVIRGGGTLTTVLSVAGRVVAEIEGIRFAATANHGGFVQEHASLVIDRCEFGGALTNGLGVRGYAFVQFEGNVLIEDFAGVGVNLAYYADVGYAVTSGTITIRGGAGVGSRGIAMNRAALIVFSGVGSGFNLTIEDVEIGIALGFNASFTWQSPSSTITIDNVSTLAGSRGIRCTDLSTWSTDQALVIDHVAVGFEANSISYIEARGSRTLTNVGTTSDATQNSVIYLP